MNSGERSRADATPPAVPWPHDLITLLDLLQSASEGSPALDARIDVLVGPAHGGVAVYDPDGQQTSSEGPRLGPALRTARWSEDLTALLRLVPGDHNYSLGERDGVVWAWIQPNDDWTPALHEMRHDHPRGSGLIVARTLPLAMAAAVVALRALPGRPSILTSDGDTGTELCQCGDPEVHLGRPSTSRSV